MASELTCRYWEIRSVRGLSHMTAVRELSAQLRVDHETVERTLARAGVTNRPAGRRRRKDRE
jgi:hypothetical protein